MRPWTPTGGEKKMRTFLFAKLEELRAKGATLEEEHLHLSGDEFHKGLLAEIKAKFDAEE